MSIYRGLDKLTPEFRKQVENWFKEKVTIKGVTKKVSDLVFVTETWRSAERQMQLFKQVPRASWLDGVTQRSLHQDGLAVDIAFTGNELYPKDQEYWRAVADAAKKHGIEWGFDLWKWDKPHFQDAKAPYIAPDEEYALVQWQIEARNFAMKANITNGERPLDPMTRVEMWETSRKLAVYITSLLK